MERFLFAYICRNSGVNSKEQVQAKHFRLILLLILLLSGSLSGFANQNILSEVSPEEQCSIVSDNHSNSENSIPHSPGELAEKPDQKEESKSDVNNDLEAVSSVAFLYYQNSRDPGIKTCDCSFFNVRFIPLYRLFHSWKHFV
jgi:hypothetical protein